MIFKCYSVPTNQEVVGFEGIALVKSLQKLNRNEVLQKVK
jgi:hypothetical protein